MSFVNTNSFLSLVAESVSFGKSSIEQKCSFCGTELTYEQTKRMKTRIWRMRYLVRSIEEGSTTAQDILWKILLTREYLGGLDFPEGTPSWWVDMALKISKEIGDLKHNEILKEINDKKKNDK